MSFGVCCCFFFDFILKVYSYVNIINNMIMISVTLTSTSLVASEHAYHYHHPLNIFQADPIQLKSLLTILRLVAKGDDVSKLMSVGSMQPPSTAGMKALQTSMVVTSRKDYPLTTSFPSALQNLTVCCYREGVHVGLLGNQNSHIESGFGSKRQKKNIGKQRTKIFLFQV